MCQNNPLTTLYIKTGKPLVYIYLKNNVKLDYICCNPEDIKKVRVQCISNGFDKCKIDSFCSVKR